MKHSKKLIYSSILIALALIAIVSAINLNYLIHKNQTIESNESVDSIPPIAGNTTEENKIINFQPKEIVLTDSEIKENIGFNWKKIDENNFGAMTGNEVYKILTLKYGKCRGDICFIDEYPQSADNISMTVEVVSPHEPNPCWQGFCIGVASIPNFYKGTRNEINIGEKGFIISGKTQGTLVFSRNNVLFVLNFPNDINIESVLDLAKEQDSKILKILSMVIVKNLTFLTYYL